MNHFAGALQLRPGAPVPHNLRSTRQAWASRVAPGRAASDLPGLLAGLFSLCGHAHRTASQLAIRVVEPGLLPSVQPVAALLQRETALEHLRRIGLDWPRLLASADPEVTAAAADGLRRCPLIRDAASPAPWPAMRQWLQDEWLHMAPATWLRAWQACGADWLADWSLRHPGWLPTLLRAVRVADMPLPPAAALRPHAEPASLRALGATLALQGGFALQPRWQGQVAHTGPWARLHERAPGQAWTAWSLLGSRLAELVRLCLPDAPGETGAGWLAWGALPTGERQGLAWVEMARGLLIHQVALADTAPGAAPLVRSCQVLAPTEWNLHPEGVAAQALAALPADAPDLPARVHLLMAALDPCVPFHIATQQEVTHA
jgi:hypothetical protein